MKGKIGLPFAHSVNKKGHYKAICKELKKQEQDIIQRNFMSDTESEHESKEEQLKVAPSI